MRLTQFIEGSLKDHSVRIEWSLLTLTFLCYYSRYESLENII